MPQRNELSIFIHRPAGCITHKNIINRSQWFKLNQRWQLCYLFLRVNSEICFYFLTNCSNYIKTFLEKAVYYHTKRSVNNLWVCLVMSLYKSSCHLLNIKWGKWYFIIVSRRVNYTNVLHICIGLLLECCNFLPSMGTFKMIKYLDIYITVKTKQNKNTL